MAHMIEEMMYVREACWHGLGVRVEEAPTSEDAIRLAGLDWKVEAKPIFDQYGNKIPNYVANTRDKDNSVLGIVSEKYSIVQNSESFSFTDNLLNEGLKYETAGSLNKGKKIWLLGRMPETTVLGDEFIPYICFSNTFDGTSSIRVNLTNIRVVCQNTLNIALKEAKRSWSTKHMGDMESKLEEARETLLMSQAYMDAFKVEAEVLALKKMSEKQIEQFIEDLFPVDKAESQRKQNNIIDLRTLLKNATYAPDIANFRNSAYGMLNATTDFLAHNEPLRKTATFAEKRFEKIVEGHAIMDRAYTLLKQVA